MKHLYSMEFLCECMCVRGGGDCVCVCGGGRGGRRIVIQFFTSGVARWKTTSWLKTCQRLFCFMWKSSWNSTISLRQTASLIQVWSSFKCLGPERPFSKAVNYNCLFEWARNSTSRHVCGIPTEEMLECGPVHKFWGTFALLSHGLASQTQDKNGPSRCQPNQLFTDNIRHNISKGSIFRIIIIIIMNILGA